jgi:hypothetical protein
MKHGVALAALLLAAAPLSAQESTSLSDCVQGNLPSQSSVQKVEFRSRDRVGNGRTIRATVNWKRFDENRSRVMLRVHEPEDLNGAGLLAIEKETRADMFIYLPDLKKVKRVTSRMMSGSLFGSDFTYEDFMQLQGIQAEGRTEELEDSTFEGAPVRVVAHYPAAESGSAYERVVSYWDMANCVPVKSEMWEAGERLRKVLTIDREALHHSNGAVLPKRLLMRDLRDETSTELIIEDIQINVDIPRKLFSTSSLERPRMY